MLLPMVVLQWISMYVYGLWNMDEMVFIDIHIINKFFYPTIRHWLFCKDENVFIILYIYLNYIH